MTKHKSVLLQEVIANLPIHDNGVYVDATLGGGGHTLALAQNSKLKAQSLRLVCFDQDQMAIDNFRELLLQEGYQEKEKLQFDKEGIEINLFNENFVNMNKVLNSLKIKKVDGVIADLGISTDQLLDKERGFSYQTGGNLDLRMNQNLQVTAADLLNGLYEKELIKVFKIYADLTWEGKKITKEIVAFRKEKQIKTITDLLQIIKKAVNLKSSRRTEARVLQALRIAVNQELGSLREFLPQVLEALANSCPLLVITFHSGEDRIVKKMFKDWSDRKLGEEQIVYPTLAEIAANSQAKSAKMRIFTKI
jgi:16S rRNA (cytosine1402-N4)-methyltransferase